MSLEEQECCLVVTSYTKKGFRLPDVIAIAIASTQEEATKFTEEEIIKNLSSSAIEDSQRDTKTIEHILFPPTPTIAFLYSQRAGRIK